MHAFICISEKNNCEFLWATQITVYVVTLQFSKYKYSNFVVI